jgi:hypothetical protein
MRLTIDARASKAISALLDGMEKDIRKQVRIAVNKAGQRMESKMAKMVREEINVTAKAVKRVITRPRLADETNLFTTIEVGKDKRIPLKEFGARQGRKGVTYRISKRGGKKLLPSGFIVRSLGGHVFVREGEKVLAGKGRYKGKMRQPIVKKYGPSVWGFFANRTVKEKIQADANAELETQVLERIRFLTVKAKNQLKGN